MNEDDRPETGAGDAAVDPAAVDVADAAASTTAVLDAHAESPAPSLVGPLFPAPSPLGEPEPLFSPQAVLGGPLFPLEPSALSPDPDPAPAEAPRLSAPMAAAVGSSPVGSSPVGSSPVGSSPVGSSPVGSSPVDSSPAEGSRRRRRRPAATTAQNAAEDAARARATDPSPTAALAWVDVARIAGDSPGGASGGVPGGALLADAPRRSLARPGVLVPIAALVLIAIVYGATTAAWPLNAVRPAASAVTFQPAPAPAAAVTWPGSGSAAVGIQGIGTIASTDQQAPMASITKLVTVLASFDKLPLKPGEQGAAFEFTQADSDDYWNYLRNDESALDVPAGGSLTQYQLLEGILLGSANNYADRLAREVWGSDRDYASAGNQWLRQHDLAGITVVTPSGFAFGNVATPRALIQLGQLAVQNPVIAEIVKKKSVVLPGAGTVQNTNGLIGDTGIIGIKTGTIGDGDATKYNLLTAKDVPDGSGTVRIYADVLGETSDAGRVDASRKLYADVEAALKNQPQTVTKGTTLGTVDTPWGETTQVVADSDARVVLWNGASASATTKFALGDEWKAGDKAGTLTLKGPLDSATVPLTLRTDLEGPSMWWRLTHPLELFGLDRK